MLNLRAIWSVPTLNMVAASSTVPVWLRTQVVLLVSTRTARYSS